MPRFGSAIALVLASCASTPRSQPIQRLDTAGGVAPSTGCDAAHEGTEARVDYSANYDFYGAR